MSFLWCTALGFGVNRLLTDSGAYPAPDAHEGEMVNKPYRNDSSTSGPECRRAKSGRRGHRLKLPVGEPDPEGLRSFMRECLVPLLAEEFLSRRSGVETPNIYPNLDGPTSQLFGREDGS
jgi:hypothetical protein